MEGTVTKIRSVLCEVDAEGKLWLCKARRRLVMSDTGESKPLAVGDKVVFEPVTKDEGVIVQVLPRRTRLSRRDPRDPRTEHVIAANVEQLLIVTSVRQPPLSVGLIDRYLIAAHVGGLVPTICINKIDLAQSEAEYEEVAKMYRSEGYTALATSALTGAGIDSLRELLRDKTTVLAGHSGVGKSSLLNAVQPGLKLRTGPVSTKGRHVTSTASLLRLDCGGYVVDTPGIREFTLWDVSKRDVAQFFPEIRELAPQCRMPDCLHVHEPDCAVRAAVARGSLHQDRYKSYLRIVDTVEEVVIPRATDVEEPHRQVPRKRRIPSRRKHKQQLWSTALSEMEEEEA